MSEPKRPEGLTIAIDSLESIRILIGNLGHFHEDEIAKVDRIDQECVRALTQLQALKQPRLTPHAVDVIRNLSFECYLPLDGFIERLKAFGIEVETEKR